jgi:hypothetical protein
MCAWRVDSVNGRARLVKDIAREYAASDREITRAFGRVSGRFPSSPLVYKDFDAYVAAWRDAIVKALRAYRATADHIFSVLLDRLRDEARFLRRNGCKAAKTHPKPGVFATYFLTPPRAVRARQGRQDAAWAQGARAPRVAAQAAQRRAHAAQLAVSALRRAAAF